MKSGVESVVMDGSPQRSGEPSLLKQIRGLAGRWPWLLGSLWLVLAVAILGVATFAPAPVRIDWETATEINTAGFNLYRQEEQEGKRLLNVQLIAAKGSPLTGASYFFVDNSARRGHSYRYQLEEVTLANDRRARATFSYRTKPEPWLGPAAAMLALCGLFLLSRGRHSPAREP